MSPTGFVVCAIAFICVISPSRFFGQPELKQRNLKTFQYRLADGSEPVITGLGHVVGLGVKGGCTDRKTPCPVVSFGFLRREPKGVDRIIYDVLARPKLSKSGDLRPISLSGPPTGSKIAKGKALTVRVVLAVDVGGPEIALDMKISEDGLSASPVPAPKEKKQSRGTDSGSDSDCTQVQPDVPCFFIFPTVDIICDCDPPVINPHGEVTLKSTSRPKEISLINVAMGSPDALERAIRANAISLQQVRSIRIAAAQLR